MRPKSPKVTELVSHGVGICTETHSRARPVHRPAEEGSSPTQPHPAEMVPHRTAGFTVSGATDVPVPDTILALVGHQTASLYWEDTDFERSH